MNTVSPAFDSRAMPLAEPSTAPSAFSWWDWLGQWIAPRPGQRGSDVPTASQPQSPAAAPDDAGGQGSGRAH
ncbi:MAG TPA: hypothetical protein VFZ28_03240 [Burkholderiaceae bacterium]|nr:hypothetical protein [Burkholderiaceae bacterium]